MKNEYNIKDQVWIHLGERRLVKGRVVEIIDLVHLNEGHSPKRELYVIEIKTGIDDVYEVRDFDQISPDDKGPINLFRKHKTQMEQRLLKKIGIVLPIDEPFVDLLEPEPEEPTAEEIHAAIDRVEKSKNQTFNAVAKRPAKKRTFTKRKKQDVSSNT